MCKGLPMTFAICLVCCVSVGYEPLEEHGAVAETAGLQQTVEVLEARIGELEFRLSQLERLHSGRVIGSTLLAPQTYEVQQPLPAARPNWNDLAPKTVPTLLIGGQRLRVDSRGVIRTRSGLKMGVWGIDFMPQYTARR